MLLTLPHALLCRRFLAACVACTLPHMEADPGYQTLIHQDPGAGTSPTQHPVKSYTSFALILLRSFGLVLVSQAIRAAQGLTSIQFSPTSEYTSLAHGRHHGSLLKSVVNDGETTLHITLFWRLSSLQSFRYGTRGSASKCRG